MAARDPSTMPVWWQSVSLSFPSVREASSLFLPREEEVMSGRGERFEGGCLCGAVRYEISQGPISASHCHCPNCRKHSGAGFATDAIFLASAVNWTGAAPTYYNSSDICARGFCAKCGSTVSALYGDRPDIVVIAAGSLDDPNSIKPTHHGYVSRRLQWIKLCDGLPAYPTDIPGFEQ
jgi:hypothetical protein